MVSDCNGTFLCAIVAVNSEIGECGNGYKYLNNCNLFMAKLLRYVQMGNNGGEKREENKIF